MFTKMPHRSIKPPAGLEPAGGSQADFELGISIAGMPTRLFFNGLPPEKQALLQAGYSAFSTHAERGGEPDVQIQAWVEPGDPFIPFRPGPWVVNTSMHGERVEFVSHQEKGWFDLQSRRGELVLRPEGNPENYLRVMYAWRCLDRDALLIHASGMIRNGGGHVFFGPSGSGKTTTANLSTEAIVLSDDLVILHRERAEGSPAVRVYGVPFRGEMIEAGRANASAPLIGLYTLVKDSAHRLVDVDRTQAVARLVACVPFVMAQPENARRALALCEEITRLVRVKGLHFRQDAGFWKVIDG
jgi:hypothetical protein